MRSFHKQKVGFSPDKVFRVTGINVVHSEHSMRKNRGFTAVELLVVLAVSIIVLATAIPSLRAFVLNNRRAATVNELVTAFNLARSEALKRSQTVGVCRVADPLATPPACEAGNDWQNGWMVFNDANSDDAIVDSEDIRIYSGAPVGATLMGGRNAGIVQFGRLGTSGGTNDTIAFCDDRGVNFGRRVIVSNQGRIRTDDATTCTP